MAEPKRKRGVALEPRVKQRIAELVGLGLSHAEAAGAADTGRGVSEKTVERTLADPIYRKIADDIERDRTSLVTQVVSVVAEMLEAKDSDGTPIYSARSRGAEIVAKHPELFERIDPNAADDALLPGVTLVMPFTPEDEPEEPEDGPAEVVASVPAPEPVLREVAVLPVSPEHFEDADAIREDMEVPPALPEDGDLSTLPDATPFFTEDDLHPEGA